MALIGNRSVLLKSPGRFLNGGVGITRANFNKTGMARNSLAALDPTASVPSGYYPPVAWVMPQTAGAMSARYSGSVSISAEAVGTMGVPITGMAVLSVSAPDAFGELIAFGTGVAGLSLSAGPSLLTASIGGVGTAQFSVQTNTPLLGAEATGTGSAAMSISATATILPTNDASPLRTGAASFSFSGTLTPYAIGSMTGTTEDVGLTPTGIANSVWGKVIEAGFSADQILRILAAQAAGSATGLEGGNPQFTGLDGTTVRIDGAYSAGARTIDSLNGD